MPPIPVIPTNTAVTDARGLVTVPWRQFFSLLNQNSTSGGSAPANASYVVASADPTLTAERVATDTATIDVDIATAAQMKWSVIDDSITFAKMQNIATQRLIGRNTAGTGDPEEVTISAALDWLP